MSIDPAIEGPTRKLFGHALRAEFEDFQKTLMALDGEKLTSAMQLAANIAAVAVIDACGGESPSDSDLREVAATISEAEDRYSLTVDELHTYLAKGVFGGEALDQYFAPDDVVRLPFVLAAGVLGAYRDEGEDWWEYLDQIEAAIEAAPEASG
ncbi:MAG: hypothetical protein GEV07_02800 [Streptosporangiales bacterium]|nr:hypothetical protein [Streptosporangiales bacterium]